MNNETEKQAYYKAQSHKRLFMIVFMVVTVVAFVLTLGVSKYEELGFFEAFDVIRQHINGLYVEGDMKDIVVWNHLLPRGLAAIFVGGSLAVGGAVMQNIMRNPMADAYTTGISSGAGMGATLFFVLGFSLIPGLTGTLPLIVNAFVFSLIPAGLMIAMSLRRNMSAAEFILIGVGVMYFFSAFTTVLMLAADPNSLRSAFSWNLGNLGSVDWNDLGFIVFASIVGPVVLMTMYRSLNVVCSGDNSSKSFGVDPFKLRRSALIVISFMVAIVVCFTGTIGFVGLVAPHMVRLFVGSNMKYLIPSSFMFGAALLLLSDALSKWFVLPVGVITSIIGGPLFLFLLIKQRRQESF